LTRDQEERNRVLGFSLERHPNTRPAGEPQHPPQAARAQRQRGGAQQRVLGVSVDWFEEFADVLRPLLRRIRRG
jgi:hypothetical protein